ncbi:MAG: spermidine synthase [Myxococcota bacterium]
MKYPSRHLYASTLFLSAALLFVVQPLAARMLLPTFGGSPAVWNTCMVFFQLMLLGGYVWAHLTDRWLGVRGQAVAHAVVVAAALFFLPFDIPLEGVQASEQPVRKLLWLLTISLGVPFFCLSATAPMLQRWFSFTDDPTADDPYHLYAASNAGSLAVLLAYPVAIEVLWGAQGQALGWTIGFGVFVAAITVCARVMWSATRGDDDAKSRPQHEAGEATSLAWADRGRWTLYAFIPSSLMLGVTSYITTDIAAVPLIWIVPFVLYLLTFILAFAKVEPVPQKVFAWVAPPLLVPMVVFFNQPVTISAFAVISLHLGVFFVLAMLYHGRLAETAPSTEHLTEFYFWLSLGGALGGVFNALIAPLAFDLLLEYPLVLMLAALAIPREPLEKLPLKLKPGLQVGAAGLVMAAITGYLIDGREFDDLFFSVIVGYGAVIVAVVVAALKPRVFGVLYVIAGIIAIVNSQRGDAQIYVERSFFGSNAVVEKGDLRVMYNGVTKHGGQLMADGYQNTPITYYSAGSPMDQAFKATSDGASPPPVGVIGLGVGTIAAYARPEQPVTFYEIDPVVVDIAEEYFTYLKDSPGKVEVEVGDGRILVDRAPEGHFGLLIVDAFSSDSIPIHLATREAIAMYVDRLRDDGILLFHISNKFVDLAPALANITDELGYVAYQNWHEATEADFDHPDASVATSVWIAIAPDRDAATPLTRRGDWDRLEPDASKPTWTDNYSNIVELLK